MQAKKTDRIVITGIGLITPLGIGIESNWRALIGAKSGVSKISKPGIDEIPVQIAGEVKDFDPTQFLDKKMARQYDRYIHFSIAAGDLALQDAGLKNDDLPKDRTAVLVGSGMGGVETFHANAVAMHTRGYRRISPFFVPSTIANMASGLMAIRYGTRGANFAIVSACATGAHCVGEGYRMLQNNEADVVIAGGAEAANIPLCMAGFAAAKALSQRNDAPEQASRPFDLDRDGFVMGEGAGIIVLEKEETAKSRGARIYGNLIGVGYSSDAHHPTAPPADGSGAALAMELALKDAGIQPNDLGYINAHSTSTQLGDKAEAAAIRKALGSAVNDVAISSTKSMTGHLLGAAGSVEAAYTLLALYNSLLPPTINLQNVDPECELNHVANRPRAATMEFALSNAFGFGGTNSALVFAKF
ncbi:MAG: beta-ketoacyl-ACP synthase II [bacterium]